MATVRKIDDSISVAPQIAVADLPELAAAGFKAIINNRPDGEEPGQPDGAAIAAAAGAAGMTYTAIPVTHAGFSMNQVEAMAAAVGAADGPVLAYCRSGTRSCNLWALAAAKQGESANIVTAKAADAGYDIAGLRPLLDQVASK